MENLVGRKFKVYDNILEITKVVDEIVYFVTFKEGETEKKTGACDIKYFKDFDDYTKLKDFKELR